MTSTWSMSLVLSLGLALPVLGNDEDAAPLDVPARVDDEGAASSAEATTQRTTKKKKKTTKKKPATDAGAEPTSAKKKSRRDTSDSNEDAPAKKKTRKQTREDGDVIIEVDAKAALGEGVITGDGIHRSVDASPVSMSIVSADVDPSVQWSAFTLSLPTQLEHRETWGAHLSRTDASSTLMLEFKPVRQFKATLEGGVAAIAKPAWLDPYQPVDNLVDNGLLPTDRRSRLDTTFGARVMAVPWSKTFARLGYAFTRSTTTRDPAFDPIERPNHLTPRNNDEHRLRASLKTTFGALKPGVSVSAFQREWFFVFARDAGTGSTHAGPGGDPPNPLQLFRGLEVEPEAELTLLNEAVVIDASWRLRLVDDVYAGYYSRVENRVSLGVQTHSGPDELRLETRTRFDFNHVLYGEDSYAAGGRHPALDFEDRRTLRRSRVTVAARFPENAPVHLVGELAASTQVTNFPDYAPGIFPRTQNYVVDWDYQNASAWLGLEVVLDDIQPWQAQRSGS